MKILGIVLTAVGIGWCLLGIFLKFVYSGAGFNAFNPSLFFAQMAAGAAVAALGYFLVKRAARSD